MRVAHQQLGIATTNFNALIEDLQTAMEQTAMGFNTPNRLLALLAAMHREIIKAVGLAADSRIKCH